MFTSCHHVYVPMYTGLCLTVDLWCQHFQSFLSLFAGDFEFEKSEVLYREKVLKNLEGYIHEQYPGKPWYSH